MARRKKQNEDESQDNINNESDDTFGLPEIEYEPINRDETKAEEVREEPPVQEYSTEQTVEQESVEEEQQFANSYTPAYEEEEEEKSSAGTIILIVILLLALGGGAYYYFGMYKPEQQRLAAEKAQQEEAQRLQDEKRRTDELEAKRLADEQRRADSLASLKPEVGMIESLSERTGRYYVVVASAIDDDLIMDYAQKLSKKGVSTKIIPPFRKTKFSRLAVDSKDNYAEAQTLADALKGGDYGNEIWVVKY
jgi:hypothetical protein